MRATLIDPDVRLNDVQLTRAVAEMTWSECLDTAPDRWPPPV